MSFLKFCRVLAIAGCGLTTVAGSSFAKGTWETDLAGRDLDGDIQNGYEAYFDRALNITWLANANYARSVGVGDYGVMFSGEAESWAKSVTVYGLSGWRLPHVIDQGDVGCIDWSFGGPECGYNVSPDSSELAHMFHVTLGNDSRFDVNGIVQPSSLSLNWGPFSYVGEGTFGHSYHALSTTVPTPDPYSLWNFDMRYGAQATWDIGDSAGLVWLVRDGDVTPAVPESSSILMLLGGLAVASGTVRRQRKKSEKTN